MEIQTSGGFAEADVQALAVAVFKDESADEGFLQGLDAASGGLVRSVLESEEIKGKEGETAYLHLPAGAEGIRAKRLLLVGVGDRAEYRAAQVSQFAGAAARALRARNVKTVGLAARFDSDAALAASAAVEGAVIGLFEPDKYRTIDREERSIGRLVVVGGGGRTRPRCGAAPSGAG